MSTPTDSELKEMIVEAMNGLRGVSDDGVLKVSECMGDWHGLYWEEGIEHIIPLGIATCLSMRRDASMKGEKDGSPS